MEIIDQKSSDYVWDNLNKLAAIFSEDAYQFLVKFKKNKDKESFESALEFVIKADEKILKKIKLKGEDIGSMSIDDLIEALEITAYDSFLDKKIYIEKSLFFIDSYKDKDKDKDEKYANLINNLAIIYQAMGCYKKAEPLLNKALKIRKNVLGEQHPETMNSYTTLALLYRLMGDYKKSKLHYNKALKIIKIKLGEEHSYTAMYSDIHTEYDLLMQELNKAFFLNKKNSNLNLTIDSITIENFKQYKAPFNMNFSDRINIIIGQNATGKTTLLQAITLGLLKKNSFDTIKDYHSYISKGENEAKITIKHNENEKIILIKKDKRIIENDHFIPFVLAYGSNFFTKYNISADKIVDDILNETVHKNFAHTIFSDYTDEFFNPLTILNEFNRSNYGKVKEKINIIVDIVDTINKFLEGYSLIERKGKYFFQKNNDKTVLYLEDLSEGYRGSVLLITDMLIKILGVGWTPQTIEGIVLIDEFDKHLHPRWQSKLVNQLKETFPKIQFIMTTHNPMSILDRNPDEITILKEIDAQVIATRGNGTKSIDISTVLLEYFNVDSTISESMQEKINLFNRLKLQKKLTDNDSKELKKVEVFLGNTVASNFIYDRKYLKFLEYIKEHKDIDFDKYQKIDDKEMSDFLEDFGDFFND